VKARLASGVRRFTLFWRALLLTRLTRWKEKDHRMTRMNANVLEESSAFNQRRLKSL
jgi:hypothetical protein